MSDNIDLVSWASYDYVGMSIPNPKPVLKITGSPEFLEALVQYFESEEYLNSIKQDTHETHD